MLNDRLNAAWPIAEKINKAEASFNESISLLGQLIADIPAARAKLGRHVPLNAGVDACESLAAAAVAVSQGYRQVVQAHQHLAGDKDDLGLRTVSWGDINECPETGSAATPPLSLVTAA